MYPRFLNLKLFGSGYAGLGDSRDTQGRARSPSAPLALNILRKIGCDLLAQKFTTDPLRTCIKKSLQNIRDIFAPKTTPSGPEKRIFPKMAKIKFPL